MSLPKTAKRFAVCPLGLQGVKSGRNQSLLLIANQLVSDTVVRILRFVPSALWCCLLLGCRHLDSPPSLPNTRNSAVLHIGAAEVDITPPAGHRMAGYFDERLATGTHDPLKAKAIVLQQDADTLKGGHSAVALVF